MKTYIDAIAHLENRVRKCRKIMGKSCPLTKEDVKQVRGECPGVPSAKSAKSQFLLDSKMLKDPVFMELVEYSNELGILYTYRHISKVPIEMVIYDDFAAMVELEEDIKEPLVLLIQNRQMISSFIITFDSLWDRAKPVGCRRR